MLWSFLFDKLSKQPLRVTKHNHVTAVIDGKNCKLDLKFDTAGKPYFVLAEE